MDPPPSISPKRKQMPMANIFAARTPAPPSSAIPSSSPAFGTPVHPLKPFKVSAPTKHAILPIILPPATLRPLAFRTFTKKHSLTLASSALQELATFIGRHCGSAWREEGLAEKVLEEVAKSWKSRNGGVIVDGASPELKDILKNLEGNMSGGKIVAGARGLSRQNSLLIEPGQDADMSNARLGLRPAQASLAREDSQQSFGMSSLGVEEEEDDENIKDPRKWFNVIDAYDQPRYSYNVAKKHFESHHMLLGMLNVLPAGGLAISDLTATIALDVSQAVAIPEDSAWFAPGMIVLVDGVYEEEEESVGKGLSGSSGVGGTLGGRFQGFFIGQPPCEKRRATLGVSGPDGGQDHTIGGGFGWIDFLGVGSERAVGSKMRKLEQRLLPRHSAEEVPSRGRMVIIGELNLDQPRTLQALRRILAIYAAEPEGSSPMTFVVTGNFTQHAVLARGGSGGSIEYKEYFDALASALSDYPTLLQTSTFVFVPGDNDGWISSFTAGAATPLPRKGAPDVFTSRIRRVFAAANAELGAKSDGEAIWTSNPSRLTLFGPNHEVVVFRDDISARLRRTAVRLKSSKQNAGEDEENQPPETGSGADDVDMAGNDQVAPEEAMDLDNPSEKPAVKEVNSSLPQDIHTARKLVKTILDQGYLSPFRQATRPVHWDYATALHLYPLPTSMVLVDTTAPPFCVTYEGCHVMNPGSILVPGRTRVSRWIEYEIGKIGKLRETTF
ncbi:hypothetical protein COL5a_003185 [Colletotrichum fioriniae]|nr:uncharacterized protein COL516b_004356 [Colletotrichum fioriniae]KAJ0307122.1 hypothetical protein COL516b_004356 [Colletotrichum fioriniae]KAJ0330880.1 hypothetical protein COL5a_003185 [Colletotrichum fioriniae]